MEQPVGHYVLVPNTTGSTSFASVPQKVHNARIKSLLVTAATSNGAGTATFQFYGSNYRSSAGIVEASAPAISPTNTSFWAPVGSPITLNPNIGPVSDGFTDTNAWTWIAVVVTNLTGTNIQVGVYISG